jgi:hypothetical protein
MCRITGLPDLFVFLFVIYFLCGICVVTLRKDYSLHVSENTVLRRMYEPERKKMRRLEKLLHIFNIFLVFDALDN